MEWTSDPDLVRRLSSVLPNVNLLEARAKQTVHRSIGSYLQGRAARASAREHDGTWIPGVCSVQLLTACNLRCKGCHVSGGSVPKDFDRARYHAVMDELEQAGCRFVLLLGGEPMLLAEEVFAFAERFPSMTFLVFTNGLLWDDDHLERLEQVGNLVPMISVEGDQELTDARRGPRVFERLSAFQQELAAREILHGISVMVHSGNANYLREQRFLTDLFESPHHFAFYMAYTARGPCASFDPMHPLDMERFYQDVIEARETRAAPILFLPQDEMAFLDGCGGSRLLVHLNSDFSLARCPYTYDDVVAQPGYESIIAALQDVQSGCGVEPTCLGLDLNKAYQSPFKQLIVR